MDQAEQLCDAVCIIAQGRKVLDGAVEQIRRRHAGHKYRIEFDSITPAVLALMESGDPVLRRAVRVDDAWEIDLPDRTQIQAALARLVEADVHLAKFEHIRPSLHQIFVEHVGQADVAARRPEVAHHA